MKQKRYNPVLNINKGKCKRKHQNSAKSTRSHIGNLVYFDGSHSPKSRGRICDSQVQLLFFLLQNYKRL